MIQLAIALQLGALLAFALAFIDHKTDDAPSGPIVGRTYDFYIPTGSGAACYAQQEVIEVKEGYVRSRHIMFTPSGERENIETLRDFQRFNTLIPVERNPFATATNNPEAKPATP
jgi:hypothetical protein